MRPALLRVGLPFVLVAMLAVCSRNSQLDSEFARFPGATESMQPRISSAADVRAGGLMLGLTLPQRSYVTVVRLFTQASAGLMASSSPGTSTAMNALEPGAHKLSLVSATTYARASALRAGQVFNAADGAMVAADSRYPIHEYVVVVTTARPLTLADQQESLADIDLRGPDDVVIQRVVAAIGTLSPGAWAASVTRPSGAMAPY